MGKLKDHADDQAEGRAPVTVYDPAMHPCRCSRCLCRRGASNGLELCGPCSWGEHVNLLTVEGR